LRLIDSKINSFQNNITDENLVQLIKGGYMYFLGWQGIYTFVGIVVLIAVILWGFAKITK
jgi:hypothetical protein